MSFGLNGGGDPVFAPQRPIRTNGGFINLGFPLGRIFHAEPTGRNAGWQLYLHYAFDQAKTRDVLKLEGNNRSKNDLAAGTLYWKMNNLVSFVLVESMYRTRIANPVGYLENGPLYEGVHAREWHDFRSEFGPIFTF